MSITSSSRYFLERPRINSLLEKAIANPVVLVTAGEGCGKTQAVYSFLRRRKEAAVWIPLSERDNDPWHFWESVINALYDPRTRKALEEIGFPESPGQINRCFQVLQEAVRGKEKRIIVADDCQVLRGSPVVRFFQRLMAFPFPWQSFILISRTEPALNTMAMLSKGLLSRISADDLRFNEEEIGAYFLLRNTPLSAREKKEVFNDTEGWALAVSLIEEEMRRGNKGYARSLLESGNLRSMEEALFASIPTSLQRFLVLISLFEQWPLDVLERIAASLPEKFPFGKLSVSLNRLSSFLRFDTYLNGFRIHRVFLDFLREKQTELSGEEIKTACTIKAKWCMENNMRIEAAINYGMAGDYGGLMNTIYSFPRLLPRPAAASILEILDRVLNDPKRNENDELFLFLRYVTRAGMLVNIGHYDEARTLVCENIRELETWPPSPHSSWMLSSCYNTLAALSVMAYRKTRDINITLEYYQRGNYYYMRHPFPVAGPATKANIGTYAIPIGHPPRPGEFEEFVETIATCIPHVVNSIGGCFSGTDSLCRAELAFFKNDLNAAELHCLEAISKAREKGQYEVESKSLFYLLRIHLCNGNARAGLETWKQMKAQLDIEEYINRYVINDIMAGWFFAHIGEIEQVADWLKNEFEESGLNYLFHNFESMVKAKSLFAERRYTEALKFLERKELLEGLGSFHLGMLEITVLKAALLCRMGNEAEALKALEAAYEMSAPNSLDMPFVEQGEDMRCLAGLALQSDNAIPRSWLETIRSKASIYEKKLALTAEPHLSSEGKGSILLLTSQELSVLKSISKGHTREKIAEDFSISISTVKNIIKIIYDKLGAFNRADAIRIASKAGLLKNSHFS